MAKTFSRRLGTVRQIISPPHYKRLWLTLSEELIDIGVDTNDFCIITLTSDKKIIIEKAPILSKGEESDMALAELEKKEAQEKEEKTE